MHLNALLVQLEIEEATRKLRLGEWSTDDADRYREYASQSVL